MFSKLRKNYDVYVDKTMFIYAMAQEMRYQTVFLARPRRFGKSLLCSTIEALFRNERELFDGLAISKTDWIWQEHPIIHISLDAGNFTENVEVLIKTLNNQINHICNEYGISPNEDGELAIKFSNVIIELYKKSGEVVIIIDEYDNPLLSTIDKPELNTKLREQLKGFYSVIKQYEQYIRFAFITGVTKFARTAIFSGLNKRANFIMISALV